MSRQYFGTAGDSGVELRVVFEWEGLVGVTDLTGYTARFALLNRDCAGTPLIAEDDATIDAATLDGVNGTVEVYYTTDVLAAGRGQIRFSITDPAGHVKHAPDPEDSQIFYTIRA